jgi:SAM-dependent methyltransferase
MKKKRTYPSRDLGLELGFLFGHHFLNLKHLHYGLWGDDLEVGLANLAEAQERHLKMLLAHIPPGVKSILEIGCGTGRLARTLAESGYTIDCVGPAGILTEAAAGLLEGRARMFRQRYEDFIPQRLYDLVLFSESFQYVNLQVIFEKTPALLSPGGHVLILYFFRKETTEKSTMGGGHRIERFHQMVSEGGFDILEDIDLTEQAVPNMELLDAVMADVARPAVDSCARFLSLRHPFISRLCARIFRKRIQKLRGKYFGDKKLADIFRKFKSYRLILLRKAADAPGPSGVSAPGLGAGAGL